MASRPRQSALIALLQLVPFIFASSPHTAATTSISSTSSTSAAAASTTVYAAMTSEGCFASSGDMVDQGSYTYQSSGYCQGVCVALGKAVLGLTQGNNCWCGDLLPAADTKVADSECDITCDGYGAEDCGGSSAWTVWLTGLNNSVGNVADNSTSDTSTSSSLPSTSNPVISSSTTPTAAVAAQISPTTTAQPSAVTSLVPEIITVGGQTIVSTVPITTIIARPTTTPTNSAKSTDSSSSKAGIAAGVVVGVVALAAIVGGVYLYLRRRRSQNETRGHRRASSLNAFSGMTGMKPTLPRLSTMNDSRLDPRLVNEKRQSGVSIFADNEDYSRRILKVTNPDGN